MAIVNIHDAKSNLSRLLIRVESGEEIIIAKAGKPIARLIPYTKKTEKRKPGTAKGQIIINDSFYEPLPDFILEKFEK